MSGTSIWRRRVRWWLPALAFLLLNIGALATFRLVYAGRVEAEQARFERASDALRRVRSNRRELEQWAERARAASGKLDTFFGSRLGTEAQRLTATLAEVKRLARSAGLDPTSISYDGEEVEDLGVVRRSIRFTVEGGYVELRRLINLLELTDTFITLEQISLTENAKAGAKLRINLTLASLFVVPSPSVPPAAGPVGGGQAAPSPAAAPAAGEPAAEAVEEVG